MNLKCIKDVDPDIAIAIESEISRQQNNLELIASENVVSGPVMEAMATPLTNKYAEGYPGKRYYGGCEHVDTAEAIAIERAKALFGAAYANVQPHSGSQANMAALFGFLEPGDTVMGMDLAHGGHLTHGAAANFSGKLFNFVHYGVEKETGMIDMDHVEKIARECSPKLMIVGASAYPRILDFKGFAQIAKSVGAKVMVDMAHIAGLVAGGVHPNPVPHADVVTSTTHKTLRGPRGGLILAGEDLSGVLNKQIFPGIQGGPLMHVIASKAIAFKEASTDAFKAYQVQIVKNAAVLAEALIERGFDLVSGGTDNHLMLLDLTRMEVTGKEAEEALDQAGITANKNVVPFDTRSPFVTSGVRIGTPVLTTRGMKEAEMVQVADFMARVLKNRHDVSALEVIRSEVTDLCQSYPLF